MVSSAMEDRARLSAALKIQSRNSENVDHIGVLLQSFPSLSVGTYLRRQLAYPTFDRVMSFPKLIMGFSFTLNALGMAAEPWIVLRAGSIPVARTAGPNGFIRSHTHVSDTPLQDCGGETSPILPPIVLSCVIDVRSSCLVPGPGESDPLAVRT